MKTEIIRIENKGEDFLIELSESPFRKAAGGQPCDTGFVSSPAFKAGVVDALDENRILVRMVSGTLKEGECIAEIDAERRNLLTRMHTAEHILFRSLQSFEPSIKLEKINLTETASSIFFFADKINWDTIFNGEELANKIISEGRLLKEKLVKKEEAGSIEMLRIKTERIKSEDVRIIEIEGFDKSACAGTHCHSTSEVGSVLVTALLGAKPPYEIKFMVDTREKLYSYAKAARILSFNLGTETEKLVSTVSNLKQDLEKYKALVRNAPLEVKEINKGSSILQVISVEGYDSKDLIVKAGKLVKNNALLIAINSMPKGSQVSIFAVKDSNKDASEIFRQLSLRFNSKGNGKKEFASGILEANSHEIIHTISSLLQ